MAWPCAIAIRPGGRWVPQRAPVAAIVDLDLRIEKGRHFSKIWHTPRYRVEVCIGAGTPRNAEFWRQCRHICRARKLGLNYASAEFAERYFPADPRIGLEPRNSATFAPRPA